MRSPPKACSSSLDEIAWFGPVDTQLSAAEFGLF